jgi:hypothetical protein
LVVLFVSALWLLSRTIKCPDASILTVGSIDAPCRLLYHCPIVTVGLCCRFCDFAVSFWYRQTVPKWDRECSFLSQKRTARRFHFLRPCLGSFFEVFCIRVAEAQCFGFNETLWLMATGRATVPTLYMLVA